MQQKINFNINDCVLVKLTEFGKVQLCKDHYQFWIKNGKETIPEFNLPKEDGYGYSKWQLWDLMNLLGKYCELGTNPPFETDIILLRSNK